MTPFDSAPYGASLSRSAVITDIMDGLREDFHNISSPLIPSGKQLDINFELGTIGDGGVTANGDSNYFYIAVGSANDGGAPLGEAFGPPSIALPVNSFAPGTTLGAIYTDQIDNLVVNVNNAFETRNLILGTLSHEIGHTVGLTHCAVAGSTTPNGLDPVMATGAIDLPNAARLNDREFGSSCNTGSGTQNSIQTLVTNLGLADTPVVPEPTTILILAAGLAGVRFMRHRVA